MNPKAILLLIWFLALTLTLGVSPAVAATNAAVDQPAQQSMQSTQQGTPSRPALKPMAQLEPDQAKDAPIYIGPIALGKIQQVLSQKGFEAGRADGIWGNATASALTRFQQVQGLAPTGNLNIETIQALGLSEILQGQVTGFVPPIKFHGPGAQLFISPAGLRDFQQSLQSKGFDVGKVDGVWGDMTRQAILDYQHQTDMLPTGKVDLTLLERCGMSKEVAALNLGRVIPEMMMGERPTSSASSAVRGYYGENGQMQSPASSGQNGGKTAMMVPAAPAASHSRGAALFAGSDVIREIQLNLNSIGFDPGLPNGDWNDATASALREYQIMQNMPPTGRLTIASLQKLLGNVPTPGGMPATRQHSPDKGQMNK